ncbi:universal stress protein [Halomicroarcula sp. GCM10025709]|uniref:universal stress protein n=1 Tax=Haloarcula TaxID=2237 RepID=UPI0024C2BCDD|nr:universal stress protein [Halomicroarcula sp. YJ-61-S]
MYDTILVPTDGSDHALRAAAHALALGNAFDATVHVLAVVDVDAAAGPINAGGVSEEYVDRLRDGGRESIDAVEALADGDSVQGHVVEGRPSKAILEFVESHDVDLVSMGTHGRTGVRRFVAGSVTEDVLRQSPVPVLTTRASEDDAPVTGYDDILLPTDGSERAGVAVDHCIALATAFDATVHVLTVVDLGAVSGGPDQSAPVELLETLRENGQRTVESTADRIQDAGCPVETEVREGYPARDILDYAAANGIDLLTMSTAGQTGLSRFLLGSTTERVVRHASMPVFAINARSSGAE